MFEISAPPNRKTLTQQMAIYIARLQVFLASDAEMPIRATPQGFRPDLARLAELTEIPEQSLATNTQVRKLLIRSFKTHPKSRLRPSEEEQQAQRTETNSEAKRCLDRLGIYLDGVRQKNGKLPRKFGTGCSANRKKIAELAKVPLVWLARGRGARILARAERELGVERPSLTEHLHPLAAVTYRELVEFGTLQRRNELVGKPSADQQVRNTRTHLYTFMHVAGRTADSLIAADFGTDFEKLRDQAIADANEKSALKRRTELKRWSEYVRLLAGQKGLPCRDGIAVILHLMGRYDLSINELIFEAKLRSARKSVVAWLNREARPDAYQKLEINKIEKLFGLPDDAIAGNIEFRTRISRQLQRELFPPEFSDRKLSTIRKYLPGEFEAMPEVERFSLVRRLVNEKANKTIGYRTAHSEASRRTYRLKMLPPQLAGQFEELRIFKTADIPPYGMVRAKPDGRRGITTWEESTASIYDDWFRRFFGAMCQPANSGGLEIDPAKLTLALLAKGKLAYWFQSWAKKRQGRITNTVAMAVVRLIGLLDPETGFIPQSPELAATLPLIDGYITERDRLDAAQDWRGFCRRGYHDLIKLNQQLADLNIQVTRDPFLPILPILDSPQPLDFLTKMAAKLAENMPSRELAPRDYAVRMRDRVMVEIEIETGLRAENMAGMTWLDDGTGNLRRLANGHFMIDIPYRSFKNWRGPFFGSKKNKHDYEKGLDPALTPLIEEYLLVRHLLLGPSVCSNLFVTWHTDAKGGIAFSPDRLSSRWRGLTVAYLAYDPISETGIPGVFHFGIHAARHIIATHHLKLSGSFADAADAIHDSVEVVESHYGRFLPRDRHERIKSVSRESRQRANGAVGELTAA